jgi:colicin import membrane protein
MAHPGVVLRCAVGTEGKFNEHADLPKNRGSKASNRAPKAKPVNKARGVEDHQDGKADKAAVIEFEKEKARRDKEGAREEAERRKAEAAEEREEKRRQIVVVKAEATLEAARERHEKTVRGLDAKRNSIEEQLETERQRWKDEEEKLQAEIDEARR